MRDFTDDLRALRARLDEASGYLKIDELRARRPQLETEASRPDLWDDADRAKRVTGELSAVIDDLDLYDGLLRRLEDAETLVELGEDENDDSVEQEIDEGITAVSSALDDLELRALFTGEYDDRDAICEVNSGAGGTDAQDWAEMMLRMYLRWAERRGLTVEMESANPGTEAGLSSATFIVRGRHAHGLLESERGVHRLIRISPFDSQARRHTAFASMMVVPDIEEGEDDVDIDEKDLRIDTYRSSGAGGQHVNVTDSAVRITHLPTGIVTSCQNERSQHQNKDKAMQILAARLADLARQERAAELAAIAGEQQKVEWGSQIRSYFVHPEQRVKDHRTNVEVGNVEAVFDGDLDPFMEAYLRWRRSGSEVAN